jgi:hypothetical protein
MELTKRVGSTDLDFFLRKRRAVGSYCDMPEIDQAIREGGSLKGLDAGLIQNKPMYERFSTKALPFFNLVNKYPAPGDGRPRMIYGAAMGVSVKGREGSEQTELVIKASKGTLATYFNQPTGIDWEDVQDMGGQFLDIALWLFEQAYAWQLNIDCLNVILAAAVAKAEVADEWGEVSYIETAGPGALTLADVNALWAELPSEFKRYSVWAGNAAMAARFQAIRDPETNQLYWPPTTGVVEVQGREFILDEGVADDTLILAAPTFAVGVAEKKGPGLCNVERDGSAYKPVFTAIAAVGLLDAHAAKVLKIQTT